ncbi:MAG: amidohydrolase, partial [Oscillospiraceae bacterium]|nr:amidohydrolase [Oscillospiraceae bacterium]
SSSLYAISPQRARELIDTFGVENVLFGTDYPMWEPKPELEMIDKINLTQNEREMIFHENAERLLNL